MMSSIPCVMIQAKKTIGARWTRKSLNERFAAEPMSTFGGSPIRVATPPVFDRIASPIRYGIGVVPISSAIDRVTGATTMIVVTLSNTIDTTVVRSPSTSINRQALPLVNWAARTAR